jgi:hypothetical protein
MLAYRLVPLVAVLFLVGPVGAAWQPLPPSGLMYEWSEGGVLLLEWLPTDPVLLPDVGDEPSMSSVGHVFKVYGYQVGVGPLQTISTSNAFVELDGLNPMAVYEFHVTDTFEGRESTPSQPLTVTPIPECSVVGVSWEPPFVGVRPWCIA